MGGNTTAGDGGDGGESGSSTAGDTAGGKSGEDPGGAGSGGKPNGGAGAGGTGNTGGGGAAGNAAVCADGLIECGGGKCPLCDTGKMCRNDSNCVSDRCIDNVCEPGNCMDGRTNNNETDRDCGGPDGCPACDPGQNCEEERDCADAPNSSNSCGDDGTCERVCDANYDHCTNVFADGCETNLMQDPDHCGECGNACDDTNGTPTCNGGVCGIQCSTGYEDCSGGVDDGCETNIVTDDMRCGDCTTACSGNQSCHEAWVSAVGKDALCCRDASAMPDNQLIDLDTACFTINPTTQSFVLQNQMGVDFAFDANGSCLQESDKSGTIVKNGASREFVATCDVTFILWDAGRNDLLTNARVFWWNVMN